MHVVIRDAAPRDVPSITAIYNDAVRTTTAVWNSIPVDEAGRTAWMAERVAAGNPVLVAMDEADAVVGYATFGDFRSWPGYRYTVEHSVYVSADAQGRGVGTALMGTLIERARQAGRHVMVGGVEASNSGSIALHERLGFTHAGTLRQVGAKFGTWLDLTFLLLVLDDRPAPDPDVAAR